LCLHVCFPTFHNFLSTLRLFILCYFFLYIFFFFFLIIDNFCFFGFFYHTLFTCFVCFIISVLVHLVPLNFNIRPGSLGPFDNIRPGSFSLVFLFPLIIYSSLVLLL